MSWQKTVLFVFVGLLAPVLAWAQTADKKKGKDFTGQSLQMADFKSQNLEYAIFNEAKLFLAYFNGATLTGASFLKADVTSATFKDAIMISADMRGATVSNASFERANLSQANLEGLDFAGTSLQGADLRAANVRKVVSFNDITGADFRGADLRGATLLGAKDYSKSAKFTGAKYDKFTRWPTWLNVEASGAVLTDPPAAGDSIPIPGDKKKPQSEKEEDNGRPLAPNKPAGAPSEETVKKALETGLWGPPLANTTHRYRYSKMEYGNPFERVYDTTVGKLTVRFYPVTVVGEIISEFRDGTSKTETKNQNFHFYKNEFGEWTFFFTGDNKK